MVRYVTGNLHKERFSDYPTPYFLRPSFSFGTLEEEVSLAAVEAREQGKKERLKEAADALRKRKERRRKVVGGGKEEEPLLFFTGHA